MIAVHIEKLSWGAVIILAILISAPPKLGFDQRYFCSPCGLSDMTLVTLSDRMPKAEGGERQ